MLPLRNVRGKVPNYVEVFVDEGDLDVARVLGKQFLDVTPTDNTATFLKDVESQALYADETHPTGR